MRFNIRQLTWENRSRLRVDLFRARSDAPVKSLYSTWFLISYGGLKQYKMYIPRHHKHRILCIFAEANLHYSFAICRLKQDLRKTHLQFNIQALMMPEGPSLLPTSISIAPNFHRLLSWPWLWQDLSRCIMSYEVAWQHCQDLFRVSKAFKCFAAFDGDLIAFEDFVGFLFTAEMPQVWSPSVGGAMCMWGEFGAAACVSTAMCYLAKDFHPCSEGMRSERQVARDLGHSEVNQLVILMNCSWHSIISILIFYDIRWYAMLPNDILLQHSKSSGSCPGRSVHITTSECSSNSALEMI